MADCLNLEQKRVGDAYIAKTPEIISFLQTLGSCIPKLPPQISMTAHLEILEPDYFKEPSSGECHGIESWQGPRTQSDIPDTRVHSGMYSVLALRLENKHPLGWKEVWNQMLLPSISN